MSTKSSIAYIGGKLHLYHECMDHENVYLELQNVEFEATNQTVMVRIPIEIMELIKTCPAPDLSLCDRTDEELQQDASNFVEKRLQDIADYEKKTGKRNSILSIWGAAIYGTTTQPKEEQITLGLQNLKIERSRQQELRQKIKDLIDQQKPKKSVQEKIAILSEETYQQGTKNES